MSMDDTRRLNRPSSCGIWLGSGTDFDGIGLGRDGVAVYCVFLGERVPLSPDDSIVVMTLADFGLDRAVLGSSDMEDGLGPWRAMSCGAYRIVLVERVRLCMAARRACGDDSFPDGFSDEAKDDGAATAVRLAMIGAEK